MHWALGEADMCRRANVLPWPLGSNRPEPASAPPPSAGRVAQRDRMRGSTRVFEGRDITTITSPSFHSINGNGNVPYPGVASPMGYPNISNGHSFPGYDDEHDNDEPEDEEGEGDAEDEDDQQRQEYSEGPRVRRRRLGNGTRLPSLAELDRASAAYCAAGGGGGGLIKQEEQQKQQQTSRRIKHEHDRRGSGCSGGSSRRSR